MIRGFVTTTEDGGLKYTEKEAALDMALENPTVFGDVNVVAQMLSERDLGLPDDFPKGQPVISMSMLFGFMRLTVLRALTQYYITPEDAWHAIRGTWWHRAFEKQVLPGQWDLEHRVEMERRMWMKLEDPMNPGEWMYVSGQSDLYVHPKTGVGYILDYKTSKSRLPTKPYESWVGQANGYAVMTREVLGYPVEAIYIEAMNNEGFRVLEVPLLDHDEHLRTITNTAFWLRDAIQNRVLMTRDQGCKPHIERHFCPFHDLCKAYPQTVHVPEGMVFAEDTLWPVDKWEERLEGLEAKYGDTVVPLGHREED